MTLAGAKRCAYLGPAATFTEAALIDILTEHDVLDTVERVPMRSQNEMFDAVRSGEVDAAVVPIENSVEGGVPATLDALTRAGNLQIVAEAVVPVRFVLAARPGTVTLETLTAFGTHPHGEAQTRLWMQEHAPHATYHPTGSTAEAARELGTTSADVVPYQAAIGPLLAAQTYGLEVLADDIGENTGAQTRFVCVQRPGLLPQPTGWDRTTFVVGLASDRAGALLEMLEQLSARGVNMSRIESRPTGDGLGLYQFSIDALGHVHEARVAEALRGIHRVAARLQFLGSYPMAAGARTELNGTKKAVDPRVADEAFAAAQAWLDEVTGR
ncbi:prephenate dehydratase [Brevibacterium senegalense]|uniref:prephenate dehydratase n=1 Tax=Brevibacterium senegalense TaxID=1033736 RepID=UPI00030D6F6D|nr:prephenate dehydratase [Brevibacterium senegalense]